MNSGKYHSSAISSVFLSFDNFSVLNSIGIEDMNSYRNGEWFGNSSLDGAAIFRIVTFNLSDLVDSFKFKMIDGEMLSFAKEDLGMLKPRTISDRSYGRCFEINFIDKNKATVFVEMRFKRNIYVFLSIPFRFLDIFSRSKIQGNIDEDLFLEANYEILKNNHGKMCNKYSDGYADSYDKCISLNLEKKIKAEFNCTVPFFEKSEGNQKLCRGNRAKMASEYYYQYFTNSSCPEPCHTMISWFGYPFVTKRPEYKGTGFARLYFRKITKVTEDFVSYDLLRLKT